MVAISIILPTARKDYPIIGLPNIHIFQPTIESLNNQNFKDFELIIIDALYHIRPGTFLGNSYQNYKLPFIVKHIPIHQNHRFWIDSNRWNVCGSLNTGIIHAKGELLVRIDDCSEFDSNYLQKFWNGYKKGYIPLAMSIRFAQNTEDRYNNNREDRHNKNNRGDILKRIYEDDSLIKDPRFEHVKKNGGIATVQCIDWYYGYSSVPLETALKINGYDELFDGDKSFEDIDFGSRLEMAGYKNFLLDIDHQVIEYMHNPVSEDIIDENAKKIKCNYAIFHMNRIKNRWKANSDKLTKNDIQFIRNEYFKLSPCNTINYENNDKLFESWLSHQPIFDLIEERKIV